MFIRLFGNLMHLFRKNITSRFLCTLSGPLLRYAQFLNEKWKWNEKILWKSPMHLNDLSWSWFVPIRLHFAGFLQIEPVIRAKSRPSLLSTWPPPEGSALSPTSSHLLQSLSPLPLLRSQHPYCKSCSRSPSLVLTSHVCRCNPRIFSSPERPPL